MIGQLEIGDVKSSLDKERQHVVELVRPDSGKLWVLRVGDCETVQRGQVVGGERGLPQKLIAADDPIRRVSAARSAEDLVRALPIDARFGLIVARGTARMRLEHF